MRPNSKNRFRWNIKYANSDSSRGNDHFTSGVFFAESCYKNNNELRYVAKVSGKIYLTALIFYDTLQTIEQSFVVALVTFSLLPDLSRNNRNIYLISFLLQLTCLVSSSSSSVKIKDHI